MSTRRYQRGFACQLICFRALALLWSFCFVWAFGAAHAAEAQGPKRVLILYSFGRDFTPYNIVISTFQTELAEKSKIPVEYHEVSLEGQLFARGTADEPTIKYVQTLFGERGPDLVVPVGGPAVRFALRLRAQLFPSASLLLASVEARNLNAFALDTNSVAVPSHFDFPELMGHVLKVLPETTNIAVVLGSSALEGFWKQELVRDLGGFSNRFGLTWLDQYSFEQMRERVRHLPPHTVIFYVSMFVDAAGVPHEYDAVLKTLSAEANAPMVGLFEEDLGHGLVGGPLLNLRGLGVKTADVANRILNGESPGNIHTAATGTGTPIYDWRELHRWGISEDRLPPGSIVNYRQLTLWQRHRTLIVSSLAVILVQSMLIAGLVLNQRRRRKAESSLRESERRFRIVADNAPVFIWMCGVDKKCIFLNRRWNEFTGRNMTQELGTGWMERVHPEDLSNCRKVYNEAFDARKSFTMEYRLRRHDGEYRWLLAHGVPRYDAEKQFLGYIGSVVDVTEKWEAEAQARRWQLEMAHLGRLSTLWALAGSVAHELRQPLTAIVNSAEAGWRFLSGERENKQEVREALMDIAAQGQRAGEIIAEMRAMLKKEPGEAALHDMNAIVKTVLEIVGTDLVTRHVTLALRLDPMLPEVMGYGVQLRQVVLNLVMNACDAMVEEPLGQRQLTIESRGVADDEVEISVTDTGPGFSEEMLHHPIESFRTTKEKGLGLGLAICHSIISGHEGRLVLENNSGKGATIRFSLPANKSLHESRTDSVHSGR